METIKDKLALVFYYRDVYPNDKTYSSLELARRDMNNLTMIQQALRQLVLKTQLLNDRFSMSDLKSIPDRSHL